MGGGVALGYALDNPDRVERLALVDSYGLGGRLSSALQWKFLSQIPGMTEFGKIAASTSTRSVRRVLASLVADADATRALRRRRQAETDGARLDTGVYCVPEQRTLSFSGRVATNFVDDLESLSVPTLLVHGEDDPLVPPRWSERAAKLIPDAELDVIEDCGHWTPRERPDRFNERLRGWLPDPQRVSTPQYTRRGCPASLESAASGTVSFVLPLSFTIWPGVRLEQRESRTIRGGAGRRPDTDRERSRAARSAARSRTAGRP